MRNVKMKKLQYIFLREREDDGAIHIAMWSLCRAKLNIYPSLFDVVKDRNDLHPTKLRDISHSLTSSLSITSTLINFLILKLPI